MGTVKRLLKVSAIFSLFLAVGLAVFYYFGNLKAIEPTSVTMRDGRKIQFTVQEGWCAVQPELLGIKNTPASSVFIKRGGCEVKDFRKPIKLAALIQIRGNLAADAIDEQRMIELCAKGNFGLSGYRRDEAIYCLTAPKEGGRGVKVFKALENKYVVTTSFFLLDEIDRNIQLKGLENLVKSCRIKR